VLHIQGNDLTDVPSEIGRLSNLEDLALNGNNGIVSRSKIASLQFRQIA
jgi:Leucine-rich repeat (LRR) protein